MAGNMTLGQFIAKRRKYMGLTQEELGEKIGVSKSAVAKWETDGGLPDRDNLRRLSKAINTSIDDLHKVINLANANEEDMEINITPEVIAALESYGYKIIRPNHEEKI